MALEREPLYLTLNLIVISKSRVGIGTITYGKKGRVKMSSKGPLQLGPPIRKTVCTKSVPVLFKAGLHQQAVLSELEAGHPVPSAGMPIFPWSVWLLFKHFRASL